MFREKLGDPAPSRLELEWGRAKNHLLRREVGRGGVGSNST